MQKILVLAALPNRLRLDREIREIEEAIKRAVKRDSFEIKIRTAVRPQDIRRALAEERPQIVHFCGHGLEDGSLVLEDDGGNHLHVLPTGLAALFRLHTDYVKCVLLNACYSSKPAEVISQHINYVIGMNQPIEDRAAIVFAQGFYDALGYDNINNLDVIQRAFDEGIVAIQLENLLQSAIPHLWKLRIAQGEIEPIRELEQRSSNRNSEISTPTRGSSSDDNSSDRAPDYRPPQTVQSPQTDDLSSDRSIDYTRLRNLLKAGKWQDADDETYSVMLKVVGREEDDWITEEELLNFPCTDLRTIDSLWVKYSSGRFGFSVQKKIYLEVGGQTDRISYDQLLRDEFCDRVGWRERKLWITRDQVNYSFRARPGHLPWYPRLASPRGTRAAFIPPLASRLVKCNL
ncbi:MAG: GUN4 domain-containing protein [Rhizonema sp. PD38]|nr:GUN4 domain-containing protein [Rhizonema sp. PD38]